MKPIGFTVVSKDDFWQEKAIGLKNNLNQHAIDLEIFTVDLDRCDDYSQMRRYYRMKDEAFLDFASQQNRRVWLLDAEIRIIKPIPTDWIDADISVIFSKDIPYRHKDGRMCYMDTGESIFDRTGVIAYKHAVDIAIEASTDSPYYDVEAFLHITMKNDFISETIAMDRMKSDGLARASRGNWYNSNTVLVHPYDHNWRTSQLELNNGIETYRLSEKDFFNHFYPGDQRMANMIYDALESDAINDQRWLSMPVCKFPAAGYVKMLSAIAPKRLSKSYAKLNLPCYRIADWIFCPNIRLAAPESEWIERAYFLD